MRFLALLKPFLAGSAGARVLMAVAASTAVTAGVAAPMASQAYEARSEQAAALLAVDDTVHEQGAEAAPEMSRALWQRLHAAMREQMATVSLASLVQQQLDKGVRIEPRPVRRVAAPTPIVRPVRTSAPNSVFAFGMSFAT